MSLYVPITHIMLTTHIGGIGSEPGLYCGLLRHSMEHLYRYLTRLFALELDR